MKNLTRTTRVVLSLILVFVGDACSSDDSPVSNELEVGGAAGNTAVAAGGKSPVTGVPTGGGGTSNTTASVGGGGASSTTASAGGGGTSNTTVSAGGTIASGGVAGMGNSVQYAGDGSLLRGGQGGTSATTLSGFAGLPVRRCRHNQDCVGFVSAAYLCFIPAVVNGCDDGPLGYCTGPATPHCGLHTDTDPCGSCLMRPDGVTWDLPASSRVTAPPTTDPSVRCNYCIQPGSGGAFSTSSPSCPDYSRYAAGNAGIAGCSANSARAGAGGAE